MYILKVFMLTLCLKPSEEINSETNLIQFYTEIIIHKIGLVNIKKIISIETQIIKEIKIHRITFEY